MQIKIEKDIPLPTRATYKRRTTEKYPELRQLEVSESFTVTIGAPALSNHTRRVAKDTGRKFVVRPVLNSVGEDVGARVWRVA